MQILCMRHGHADAASGDLGDAERPLSFRGREQAREVGERLRGEGIVVEHVVASPLLRARQTAEIVAFQLGFGGEVALHPGLAYTSPASAACAYLEGLTALRVLAVGHMPTMPETVSLLCGRQPGAFETAQVVCVDGGRLRWTLAPGQGSLRSL